MLPVPSGRDDGGIQSRAVPSGRQDHCAYMALPPSEWAGYSHCVPIGTQPGCLLDATQVREEPKKSPHPYQANNTTDQSGFTGT